MIATINLADWFGSLLNVETPAKFFVVIALILCTAAVLIMLFVQIASYARHQAELNFKRDLVERGLGIDDIERLMIVKPAGKSHSCRSKSVEASANASRV